MKRVSYLVFQYPQLSESYAITEMRFVAEDYELDIISLQAPDCPTTAEHQYEVLLDKAKVLERVRSFAPDIIHAHWLAGDLSLVCQISRKLGIPFTVRAHSFDVLWRKPSPRWYQKWSTLKDTSKHIANNLKFLNSELCRCVRTFPFSV